MAKKTEEKVKPIAQHTTNSKGPLPKKRRGKVTSGTTMEEDRDRVLRTVRYCPSKRLKSFFHRREGNDKNLSLKAYAARLGNTLCSEWVSNKRASGRGY